MFEDKCSIRLERILRLLETILKRITSKFDKSSASSIPSRCLTGSKEMLHSKKLDKKYINLLNGTVSSKLR